LALALDPLVRALQRRGLGRRAAATVLAIVTIALILAVLVGPPAVEQAQRFAERLTTV